MNTTTETEKPLTYQDYAEIAERIARSSVMEAHEAFGISRHTLRKIRDLFEQLPVPRIGIEVHASRGD